MPSLWPFIYTLAFGFTGAYYAKRTRRNPYVWFFLASFFKIYTPILLVIMFFIKRSIKHAVLKRLRPNFQNPPSKQPAYEPPVASQSEMPLFWYYLTENKETKGPVSSLGLQQLQREGSIAENTLVWNENFENWTPFKQAFPS